MSNEITKIKEKISKAKISQSAIAEAMGVNIVHINGVLNETRPMTESLMQRIEFAYNKLKSEKV